jgi:ABC-type multidrug transport system fused ATPase/permease subunit
VTQDSLRAQIGMVTQDTSLLHRSVRDNILYGRPTPATPRCAAAERAEAHDFIAGLTDPKGRTGYDAHVGERGVKLSGGQRQRIAIARVMLKDAPILLLDEATSALDSEVEAAIQASLYRLMEGKTVVAIAHRLSTIAAMDRLVVMDQGRIVERAPPSLLAAAAVCPAVGAPERRLPSMKREFSAVSSSRRSSARRARCSSHATATATASKAALPMPIQLSRLSITRLSTVQGRS